MNGHRTILQLCSRIETHPDQQALLQKSCNDFSGWERLRFFAEEQGMGPLLHHHLSAVDGKWPEAFFRGMLVSRVRHKQVNSRLLNTLGSVLRVFEAEGVPVLVLKGAALCQTLYPDIGLRPMRDIDLLLAKEDVQHGHDLLRKNGFQVYPCVRPDDHFHLSPLYKSVDSLQVCVELHHGLFPSCPPGYLSLSFRDLYANGRSFDVDGVTAYMFAREEMLYHLYEHAFHTPLTYEPFKLISAADIVALVEAEHAELDWEKIASMYPGVFRALPCFHYLTPWTDAVLRHIPPLPGSVPAGVGKSFRGWPQVHLSEQKQIPLATKIHRTFCPPAWWLLVYYTPAGLLSLFWCRIFGHTKHVFWWGKLYWRIFLDENGMTASSDQKAQKSRMGSSVLKNGRLVLKGLVRKFRA